MFHSVVQNIPLAFEVSRSMIMPSFCYIYAVLNAVCLALLANEQQDSRTIEIMREEVKELMTANDGLRENNKLIEDISKVGNCTSTIYHILLVMIRLCTLSATCP